MERPALVWLRRDLRLADNPALDAAIATNAPLVLAFVHDEADEHAPGGAACWWLHHSLVALQDDVEARGGVLTLRRGDSAQSILELAEEIDASAVFWNRRYAPGHVATDTAIKEKLVTAGRSVTSFNGALLRDPWELKTGAGGHFKVFTPFWKALRAAGPARSATTPAPSKLRAMTAPPASDDLGAWRLLPQRPNWAAEFDGIWTPGEGGAHERLDAFLASSINAYTEARDRPDLDVTSRLSPHLAFGEISPLQIWERVQALLEASAIDETAAGKFLSEVGWREFSYVLLYHYAELATAPLRPNFKAFPWRDDKSALDAWRKGMTGYPIVDAGMRQLWRTGWMHNRVRMIVASFLVKHLLLPWQDGERWFWDCLVDADPASNAASWQWSAGCGADAAPYFRIFNPITQGEKFDPDGIYTRAFVPEVAALSRAHLQKPWTAPHGTLSAAGIPLAETYPAPIVDHGEARKRALEAFESTKKSD